MYFSKYTDTIAATTIRSKCSVLLFNEEVERYSDFVNKEDSFYYHLTYDPYQKSIVADKGEIRVGYRYQVEIPQLKITPNGSVLEDVDSPAPVQEHSKHDRVLRSQLTKMTNQNNKDQCRDQLLPEIPILQQMDDMLQWCPIGCEIGLYKNNLTDDEIDKFLMIAKSVGTYARALDCNTAFKQPSLALSAASASREITLFHAMNVLHDNNYDIGKAALSLITSSGPVLCKDELEEWSASEANLFEDALEKYGKDFNEIRKDYLPWKSMKSIIEYYYTWKTTDRYVNQKRIKMNEQESKLKQVYIPNHGKQNQSALIKSSHVQFFNQYDIHLKNSCESCGAPNTSTNQWYAYNPPQLVQLIMSGNTNPNALANAAAQLLANQQANGGTNHSVYLARLCSECWSYWKKFSAFKFPNPRVGRMNQLKNQVHKCSVLGCGREFKMKQLLVKHCGIAHGYFAKPVNPPGQNSPRPPPIRNRTAFYLWTTPMTKASRNVCTNTIKLRRLSRKPFKLVELAELNKEWSKQPRNITQIIEDYNKRKHAKTDKLTVKLIEVIHKNRNKLLKKLKKQTEKSENGEQNGHHKDDDRVGYDDEEDEEDNELVIDNNDGDKPEFLRYFEEKCKTPCYVPERIAFVKPTSDEINKHHLNLMSQNRKRPHDGAPNDPNKPVENGGTGSNETSPMSKRSLLSSNNQNNVGKQLNNKVVNNKAGQPVRLPQRSTMKPTQSLLLKEDGTYYVATANLKQMRREINANNMHKLARKPYKLLDKQFSNLYESFDKIRVESLAKYNASKSETSTKINGASSNNGDLKDDQINEKNSVHSSNLNEDSNEKKDHQNGCIEIDDDDNNSDSNNTNSTKPATKRSSQDTNGCKSPKNKMVACDN